jgi:hypothetical protein
VGHLNSRLLNILKTRVHKNWRVTLINRVSPLAPTVFAFFLSATPLAEAGTWTCRVSEPLEGRSVTFTTESPTLDYDFVVVSDNGLAIDKHDKLITESTVSTLKIKRERCAESSKLSEDGTKYLYNFGCDKWVRGFLLFDSDLRRGKFVQNIVLTAERLTIEFSDCKSAQ